MEKHNISKKFFHFVLPSMVTMLLGGFYSVIDGIFIGNAMGDNGLAAINIAWPVAALIMALGIGIGTGGAATMAIAMGRGEQKDSNRTVGNTIVMLAIISIILTIVFIIFYKQVLVFLGATGEILEMATQYLFYIVVGIAFQVFGTGLSPILRNDSKPKKAMIIMICGLITNIALDALFIIVFKMGLAGAAIATITAQLVTALPCAIDIMKRNNERKLTKSDFILNKDTMRSIIKIGTSPFGISMLSGIILMLTNWQCINYGGGASVAAYTVVGYMMSPFINVINGIGEGVQPLISYCHGAKLFDESKLLIKSSIMLAVCIGILSFVVMLTTRGAIPLLFGSSEYVGDLINTSLIFTSIGFPFLAVVRFCISYFYATETVKYSSILIYGDGLVLTPLTLLILPKLGGMGINGIWLSFPITQITLFLFAILFWNIRNKDKKLEMN